MRHRGEDSHLGINLRDLHVFQLIAEQRNTTVTAKYLGISQSAVSQALSRLEDCLGTELFDRTCRPLRLTRAGEILRLGADGILKTVRQAADEVRTAGHGDIPMLRLGLIDSFATTVGPDVIQSLSTRVERLQMWSGITPTLTAELLNREVDVIVSNDAMTSHRGLSRECLLQEPLVAAVPISQLERFRALSLAQMCAHLPVVRFSTRSHLGQTVEYYLSQRKLTPRNAMEFDASEAVLRMVSTGLGWTIATPVCLMQAHAHSMDIAVLPLPGTQTYRSVYLVYRGNELPLIMPDIIRIFKERVESTILPATRSVAPWANVTVG
jgi:DNA-binding transcriptional LysR family regulator